MTVPHNRLSHGRAEADAVRAVVESGHWAAGQEGTGLEADLVHLTGRKQAVAVGSGLGALRLALMALGVGEGDEVILPAYCCVALPNAVLALGAVPVAADVTTESWNLDPAAARQAVSEHSRALIAVHSFGVAADIAGLKETGLPIIEDCAHGLGESGMGGLGHVAVTSFYATKLVGAGEGGAVMTDDLALAAAVREARDYSDQPPSAQHMNDKMTDLCAALARVQLDRLLETTERRTALARHYLERLAPLAEAGVTLPTDVPGRIWYRFCLETKDTGLWVEALKDAGVTAQRPVWDWRWEDTPARLGACPVSDHAYDGLVSLPLYHSLREDEQALVCDAVLEVARG